MKDKKDIFRGQCSKDGCDCDEYMKEKEFDLCAYCEHVPVVHIAMHQLSMLATENESNDLSMSCEDIESVCDSQLSASSTPISSSVMNSMPMASTLPSQLDDTPTGPNCTSSSLRRTLTVSTSESGLSSTVTTGGKESLFSAVIKCLF